MADYALQCVLCILMTAEDTYFAIGDILLTKAGQLTLKVDSENARVNRSYDPDFGFRL
jgi:hypothetical protein